MYQRCLEEIERILPKMNYFINAEKTYRHLIYTNNGVILQPYCKLVIYLKKKTYQKMQ